MSSPARPNGTTMDASSSDALGLFRLMELDASLIKKADAALHHHLDDWIQHMDQWMHLQDNKSLFPEQPPRVNSRSCVDSCEDVYSVNSPARKPTKPSPLSPRDLSLPSPRSLDDALLQNGASEHSISVGSTQGIVLNEFPEKQDAAREIFSLDQIPRTFIDKAASTGWDRPRVSIDSVPSVSIEVASTAPCAPVTATESLGFASTRIERPSWVCRRVSGAVEYDRMPEEHKMWMRIVDTVLASAKKKKLYDLRDTWVMPETYMAKVQRTNGSVDFKVLVKPKVRDDMTRAKSWESHSSGVSHHHNPLHMSMPHFHHNAHLPFSKSSPRSTARSTARTSFTSARTSFTRTAKQKSGWWKYVPVLDPQGPGRLAWMAMGMTLMLYDLIVLPMQVFDLPTYTFLSFMSLFGQMFWTVDIPVTFITAVYVEGGGSHSISADFRTIARHYLTTWFPFDITVVVALWIEMIANTGSTSGNAGFLRNVRMMRFLRLARLAKFERYLQEALAAVNSSTLILCVGILKLMTLMIIISHLNACLWYAVGKVGPGGWVQEFEGTSWFYRYLTSMHWAFTQFQGTSDILPTMGGGRVLGERAYAVFIVMGALIILSSFVSSLTNMMMQLQALREQRSALNIAVREYLAENDISKGLSIRVKKYIDWKQRMQRKLGSSDLVLQMLPLALQIDLQEEVLTIITPAPGELVFSQQDHANRMFFGVSGSSRYMPTLTESKGVAPQKYKNAGRMSQSARKMAEGPAEDDSEDEDEENVDFFTLGPGDYLCEPTLWTTWEHCGVLMGVNEAQFLGVESAPFDAVVKHHPPAHVSAILYARQFVAGLNKFGKSFNDIINIEELAEEEDDDAHDPAAQFRENKSLSKQTIF